MVVTALEKLFDVVVLLLVFALVVLVEVFLVLVVDILSPPVVGDNVTLLLFCVVVIDWEVFFLKSRGS